MKPTSQEKREQIVSAKQRGEKTENIILWVKVSKSTIDKVWRRYRETGNAASKPYKGSTSKITAEIEHQIRSEIDKNNDITLEELIEELELPIKKSQLSRLLISWNISYKKRHYTQKNNNGKM